MARHPLDLAAFVLVLAAAVALVSAPTDLARRLRRNPLSLAGFGIIVIFLAVAALAPVLAPPPSGGNPYLIPHQGFTPDPRPPRPGHPLGTTGYQYDLYYGIVWGTRTALRVGLIVVAVSVLVGLVMGTIAGFYGGRTDNVLMRATDIFLAFPSLVLAVVVTSVLGRAWTRSSSPSPP